MVSRIRTKRTGNRHNAPVPRRCREQRANEGDALRREDGAIAVVRARDVNGIAYGAEQVLNERSAAHYSAAAVVAAAIAASTAAAAAAPRRCCERRGWVDAVAERPRPTLIREGQSIDEHSGQPRKQRAQQADAAAARLQCERRGDERVA